SQPVLSRQRRVASLEVRGDLVDRGRRRGSRRRPGARLDHGRRPSPRLGHGRNRGAADPGGPGERGPPRPPPPPLAAGPRGRPGGGGPVELPPDAGPTSLSWERPAATTRAAASATAHRLYRLPPHPGPAPTGR